MRKFFRLELLVAALACAVLSVLILPAQAQPAPTTYFDARLAAHGEWFVHAQYGRVWRPRHVSSEWRPYTYGHWVYTSEYGWVWVSEEPYGWIVYHYGYWVWTDQYGWVWVARDEWAPAWVDWCYGGGYVGWTPMPPDPFWTDGYYYGSWECASPRQPSRWVYVSQENFVSANVSAHVVAAAQVPYVARGTTSVTRYTRKGGNLVNQSVDAGKLKAAGLTIHPARVVKVDKPETTLPAGPNELRIFRPPIASLKKNLPGLDTSLPELDTKKLQLEPDASLLTKRGDEPLLPALPPAGQIPGSILPPPPVGLDRPLGGGPLGGGLPSGGPVGGGLLRK